MSIFGIFGVLKKRDSYSEGFRHGAKGFLRQLPSPRYGRMYQKGYDDGVRLRVQQLQPAARFN